MFETEWDNSSPAFGSMGEFLLWIAAHESECERWLQLQPGTLAPWVAEVRAIALNRQQLAEQPHETVKRIEFYWYYEVDLPEELEEPLRLNLHGWIEIEVEEDDPHKAHYILDDNGYAVFGLSLTSPEVYWSAPVELNLEAKRVDYSTSNPRQIIEPLPLTTIGDLIKTWYDEITWGGNSPADRMVKSLNLGVVAHQAIKESNENSD